MRVSWTQPTSMVVVSNMRANYTCFPICIFIYMLKVSSLEEYRGRKKCQQAEARSLRFGCWLKEDAREPEQKKQSKVNKLKSGVCSPEYMCQIWLMWGMNRNSLEWNDFASEFHKLVINTVKQKLISVDQRCSLIFITVLSLMVGKR